MPVEETFDMWGNNLHHSFPGWTPLPKCQDSVPWWFPGISVRCHTQFMNETLKNLWPFINLKDVDTKEAPVNLTAPPTFLESNAGKLWRRIVIGGNIVTNSHAMHRIFVAEQTVLSNTAMHTRCMNAETESRPVLKLLSCHGFQESGLS